MQNSFGVNIVSEVRNNPTDGTNNQVIDSQLFSVLDLSDHQDQDHSVEIQNGAQIQDQPQPQNKKNYSSKKLTYVYKYVLKPTRVKVKYFQTDGMCLIIRLPKNKSKRIPIVRHSFFTQAYVKKFQRVFPELKRAQVIKQILRLFNSSLHFAGLKHFIVNKKGISTFQVHGSLQYTTQLSKKLTIDNRISIPGGTGLLKILFSEIFYQNFSTFELFEENLKQSSNESYKQHDKKMEISYELYQKVKKQLETLPQFSLLLNPESQEYQQKIQQYLNQIDNRPDNQNQISRKAVYCCARDMQLNRYSIQKYKTSTNFWKKQKQISQKYKKQNAKKTRNLQLKEKRRKDKARKLDNQNFFQDLEGFDQKYMRSSNSGLNEIIEKKSNIQQINHSQHFVQNLAEDFLLEENSFDIFLRSLNR